MNRISKKVSTESTVFTAETDRWDDNLLEELKIHHVFYYPGNGHQAVMVKDHRICIGVVCGNTITFHRPEQLPVADAHSMDIHEAATLKFLLGEAIKDVASSKDESCSFGK